MTFTSDQSVWIAHNQQAKLCKVVEQRGEFVHATTEMHEDCITAMAEHCHADKHSALRDALASAEMRVAELRMEIGVSLDAPLRGCGQ